MNTTCRAPDGAVASSAAKGARPSPETSIGLTGRTTTDAKLAKAVSVRPELEPLLGLLFMMIDETRSLVIHFTATRSGEGTTTLAREVAVATAATGWCKVALIDANTNLSNTLAAASASPGLIETFEQGLDPKLHATRAKGVEFDTGALSTGPQGATRVDSVRKLYALLRSSYSLVIIDSPPVFSGRKASVIAGLADCAVLVVEAERTHVPEIVRAREILEQLGAKLLGVVLNKKRRRIPKLLSRFI